MGSKHSSIFLISKWRGFTVFLSFTSNCWTTFFSCLFFLTRLQLWGDLFETFDNGKLGLVHSPLVLHSSGTQWCIFPLNIFMNCTELLHHSVFMICTEVYFVTLHSSCLRLVVFSKLWNLCGLIQVPVPYVLLYYLGSIHCSVSFPCNKVSTEEDIYTLAFLILNKVIFRYMSPVSVLSQIFRNHLAFMLKHCPRTLKQLQVKWISEIRGLIHTKRTYLLGK